MMMQNRCLELLKSYCDKLIEFQITEMKDQHFYGAILCPACAKIHGRIGDAVYPLTFMYDKTHEEKYLDAAKLVIEWSVNNVKREDGSFYNDKTNTWKGISVFSAMSIGEALLHHGECLDRDTYDSWYAEFVRLAEFVYHYFDQPYFNPHINYYVTECPAMALAFLLTGDEKFRIKAYERAEYARAHFTAEGLLYGEGPIDGVSPSGLRYVDLGYNVEESLPALAAFAHFMRDDEYLQFIGEMYKAHIEFMLPDGGWDNSWGTRANKWTYWGSRTSDGCQTGLCYLAPFDAIFAEAAWRNFELYEKCSKDGLLYGGRMYIEAGEEPCVHHTFCHAKSLCAMLDSGIDFQPRVELPREKEYGVKRFDSINVALASKANWKLTMNFADTVLYYGSATTGGTPTLVWNDKVGVLFAASMASYSMSEPNNMQLSRQHDDMPNTALRIQRGEFCTVNEKNAEVEIVDHEEIVFDVRGMLRDTQFMSEEDAHKKADTSGAGYHVVYTITEDAFKISATAEGELVLPIVCSADDELTVSDKVVRITRGKHEIKIRLETDGVFSNEGNTRKRDFNVVGGFCTYPITIKLSKERETSVSITVE